MKTTTLIALLMITLSSAMAQEFETRSVALKATPSLAELIMDKLDLAYQPLRSQDLKGYIVKIRGKNAALVIEDEQFELKMIFEKKVELKVINEFNGRYRFGKAYVDSGGDTVLMANLSLAGGLGASGIYGFFNTFGRLVDVFVAYMER